MPLKSAHRFFEKKKFTFVLVEFVLLCKPFPCRWIEEVCVGRVSWPAPPVELVAVFVLDEEVLVLALLVDAVPRVNLDVGVNDVHQLPAHRRESRNHLLRLGKLGLVPREIPEKS